MGGRHRPVAGHRSVYVAAVVGGVLVFAGAANLVGARADAATPLPAGTYCQGPQPSQPVAGPTHVINLVVENESAVTVDQSPDATFERGTLDTQCGTFAESVMHSTTHPSEGNYFALVSGLNASTSLPADAPAVFGLSDCPPSVTITPPTTSCAYGSGHFVPGTASLFSLVEQQYGTTGWKTYSDSMPANCTMTDANAYATDSNGKSYNLYVARHNPALYFAGDACTTQDVPSGNWQGGVGALYTDLMSGAMPYYSVVQPNDIENGHDPTTVTGTNGVTTTVAGGTSQVANIDRYLASFMAMVQRSPQYQDGSLVVMITYDEGVKSGTIAGEGSAAEQCADPNISALATSCQVRTWIVGRYVPNLSYSTYMNPFGLLAAEQRILNLQPLLGHAGDSSTADIVDGTSANPDPFNLAPRSAPTVPGAPTAVAAVAGSGTASVTFTPPVATGGVPITSYTAIASPGGLTGSGSSSPIAVAGLTNGTPYTFTVTANNSVGTGAASAASASVTPTAAPPPTELLGDPGFESGNDGWVAFKTGTLSRVTSPVRSGSAALEVASPSSTPGLVGLTQNAVISNSIAGRSYTATCYVRPTAANLNVQIRFLEYTRSFGSFITLQANLTNALPVGVWSLAQVTSKAVNSGERIVPQIYSTNETSTTGSLIYDDCSVTGADTTTTPSAPGPPSEVTATAGDGNATVAFTAPAANGSPITSYTVTSSPGALTATGLGSPLSVAGLTNGTAYTFTVTARNSVGPSAASSPSIAVTPSAGVTTATQLLPDPGFEVGEGGWIAFSVGKLTRVAAPLHSGASALRVDATSTGAALVGLTQNSVVPSTIAGKIYTASCYVQPTTANLNVQIRFLEYAQNFSSAIHLQTTVESALPSNVWTLVTVSSTGVNSGDRMVPQIYSSNETTNTGSLIYDDCSVTSN